MDTRFLFLLSPLRFPTIDSRAMSSGGRDEDFEATFRRLYRPALSVARRILGETEADDAVAETFARALVAWPDVRNLEYLDAWVLRVLTNVAVGMVRGRRRNVFDTIDAANLVEEIAVLRMALAEALKALPRRQREVIALRHLAGLSEQEIAAAMGISVNSVHTHASRALRSLRSRLGTQWEEKSVAF